jgi:hypothetical protein
VEQILENKPTADFGWDFFGDVVFPRTAVTCGDSFHILEPIDSLNSYVKLSNRG